MGTNRSSRAMAQRGAVASPRADDGYCLGQQSASELTEEIDDFLEKTESEYLSDEDEIENMSTIDELRAALRGKEKHIKSLRQQLQTAKRIVTRNKAINQETNRELTEVLQEVLILRERNKTLEQTLEMFKSQAEQGSKGKSSTVKK